MTSTARRALLLSGGLDSSALAFVERPDVCVTIDYGQLASAGELRASRAVCEMLGLRHDVVRVDCSALGSGDLAGRPALDIAPVPEWWPFRNQLIVTLAAIHLATNNAAEILVGAVSTDGAHADGRSEFFAALNGLLAIQEGAFCVRTPALAFTTASFVQAHNVPRELLGWAHSCHTGEWACGECRGCAKYSGVMRQLFGA